MVTTTKRQKLHEYIDVANSADIDDLLAYVQESLNPSVPQDKWDDPEFVVAMEKRVKSLDEGSISGRTWDEIKQKARFSRQSNQKL